MNPQIATSASFATSHSPFDRLQQLPFDQKKAYLTSNPIISTDTYNRTMSHLAAIERHGDRGRSPLPPIETYSLQLRRGEFGYLIACGMSDLAKQLSEIRITHKDIDFAAEFYKRTSNQLFNENMWREIATRYGGKLPLTIRAPRDGTILYPGEPFMTVTGPGELIAHFEHLFHRIFYPTLVATRAHVLRSIVGDPSRFIEVGKRAAITEEQHLIALKSFYVGGGFTLTSNDVGVGLLPMNDVGTIGHRFIQRFTTEEQAFRFAIEQLPAVTLLVDLIESYQGIDRAISLKKEYRSTNKPIFIRLDSGDVKEQTLYALKKLFDAQMTNPKLDKIIVEGIESLQEIRDIECAIIATFGSKAKALVVYGAGGLIVSQNTSRSDASTGLKLSQYLNEDGVPTPTMKLSNSIGKNSFPGEPEVGFTKNGQRRVTQRGEAYYPLFRTILKDGVLRHCQTAEEARLVVTSQTVAPRGDSASKLAALHPPRASRKTAQLISKVRNQYNTQQARRAS